MVWIVFAAFFVLILLADILIGAGRRSGMAAGGALALCLIPVLLALAYGGWLTIFAPGGTGRGSAPAADGHRFLTYLTGYLLELSLSADNVLMYAVILRSFSVPRESQAFVLFWGILIALLLRAILIISGLALVLKIPTVLYLMGGILLVAGFAMFFNHPPKEPGRGRMAGLLRRLIPVHDRYEGRRLFTRSNGRRLATPLLLVLLLIGIVDVMFALDSIPAIFGITRNPVIVLTSNLFAVVAIQWFYFAIAPFIERLHYLKTGLAVVLLFIGVKMLLPSLRLVGYRGSATISTQWSLAFMAVVLAVAIGASLLHQQSRKK